MSEDRRQQYEHAVYGTDTPDDAVREVLALVEADIREAFEAGKAHAALSQPEPEYEYALRDVIDGWVSPTRYGSLPEALQRRRRDVFAPEQWGIVRRPIVKPQPWEDVK